MECTFFRCGRCSLLKDTMCSEKCKFKKTEKEFAEGQAEAEEMLRAKGLEPVMVRTPDGLIMTTRKIWWEG